MRGWIIDCHPDYGLNSMVMWVRTAERAERLVHDYRPDIYVWAPAGEMQSLPGRLEMIGFPDTSIERRRLWLGEREREALRVGVPRYSDVQDLARTIDSWGHYGRYRLFNVDLRLEQRFLLEKGLFPLALTDMDNLRALDSPWRHDYPLPQFREALLDIAVRAENGIPTFDDRLESVTVNDIELNGPEDHILEELNRVIAELDPDIVYTGRGDDFYMHYLARRAEEYGMGVELGRGAGARMSKGKSYFTYGRILYKPPAYKLRGRIHIDREQSFMYVEAGGMYGLIDLSRMSLIPVQDLSRLSPGSAISAMQVNEALRTGHLILWKKNIPEEFKTARELLVCDRGGFIHNPVVGIHDSVTELDFCSLYPNIMVRYNISPETLMCDCCPQSSIRVPEIGYHFCERERGLIPRVIEPVIRRRIACKRLAREAPRHNDIYAQRAKVLKWILVTCFGYTGYRNARFGRIECHESITAYGREILLRSSEIAERRGFRVLHGIVDSLWLSGEGDCESFCEEINREFDIPLEVEGHYSWIVFLPCVTTGIGALNRYYGLFDDGELKTRGIAVRKRDTPPLIKDVQHEMLHELSKASCSSEFQDRIAGVLDLLCLHAGKLLDGSVPLEKLILTKRVSRRIEDYRQFNDSVAALMQLRERGFEVPPGKVVRFIICDSTTKDFRRRVKVDHFVRGDEEYDARSYIDLVVRATAELISPFGWDFDSLRGLIDPGQETNPRRIALPGLADNR
ncbi:MAG TPA: DNA polymerase domain-containing protein [Methanomassiliicoccales archaeon]|nr:DNA polymerase domain-containing protein [Methanomassiliicoccales archaeon]